jgi:hypothetical protein
MERPMNIEESWMAIVAAADDNVFIYSSMTVSQ